MHSRKNFQPEQLAISIGLLVLLTVMLSQAIPEDFFWIAGTHGKALFTTVRQKVSPVATALGLRQDWTMFAPNPMRTNTYIDAEITYKNGREYVWTFPQMEELGYAERYVKERYRKFSNENLWVKQNSAIWPDAARYIARLNTADRSNPPISVRLVHYWSDIPLPPALGEPPRPERWRRSVFFSYTVSPGDLP